MLYLVRHGESEWNVTGRYQGRQENDLSPQGYEQSRTLADRLTTVGARAIASSPLRRARATAGVIAAQLNTDVRIDERLIELAYGCWEGMNRAEIAEAWPQELREWKQHPESFVFRGGESLCDLQHRVRSFLRYAFALPEAIVAVTHEAFIRVAVLEACRAPLSDYRSVRVQNASISAFSRTRSGFEVAAINDIDHLNAAPYS